MMSRVAAPSLSSLSVMMTRGKKRVAAFRLRRDCTRISSVYPILIYRPPEIVERPVHGEHDLVQAPLVPASRLSAPEGIGIGLPEFERPSPDGFVDDDHPTIGQDFLYVRKLNVKRKYSHTAWRMFSIG
jgi:hypothetical protein